MKISFLPVVALCLLLLMMALLLGVFWAQSEITDPSRARAIATVILARNSVELDVTRTPFARANAIADAAVAPTLQAAEAVRLKYQIEQDTIFAQATATVTALRLASQNAQQESDIRGAIAKTEVIAAQTRIDDESMSSKVWLLVPISFTVAILVATLVILMQLRRLFRRKEFQISAAQNIALHEAQTRLERERRITLEVQSVLKSVPVTPINVPLVDTSSPESSPVYRASPTTNGKTQACVVKQIVITKPATPAVQHLNGNGVHQNHKEGNVK